MSGAAVTPSGVREGDLAALTALCAVRGPSVLAYCRQMAGAAEAGAAAAEAFASFRLAVVQAGDTATVNPEALLIGATRWAAARRAGHQAQGVCAQLPMLLAGRAERTLDVGQLELLESHLASCWSCRAPLSRFKAAERAYRDPPDATVDADVAAQIVASLADAVPEPEPPVAPAPVNGNGRLAAQADPATVAGVDVAPPVAVDEPPVAVDQPTDAFRAPDAFDPSPQERRRRATARSSERAGIWDSLLVRLGLRPAGDAPRRAARIAEPEAGREPAAQAVAAGSPLPRVRRAASRGPRAARRGPRGTGRRPPVRLAVVLPIGLVLLALLVALAVSGVLGGNDPESSPAIAAPAAEPSDRSTPEIVVVPGARDATPDDVELAKARERERARAERRREAALQPDGDAATGATPRSASPSSSATPRPAPAPNDGAARNGAGDRGGGGGSNPRPEATDAGNEPTAPETVAPQPESQPAPDLPPPPSGAPIP